MRSIPSRVEDTLEFYENLLIYIMYYVKVVFQVS